jgi:hypothetical protein
MEEILREPVELTDAELEVVAGGFLNANANGAGSEAEVQLIGDVTLSTNFGNG